MFSSTAGFSNKMKLKSRLLPFSLIRIQCWLIFCFVVFYLWVNSANIIRWQTRHTGSFQISSLGLCPLWTDWKILLISLAKCAISGQSDTETDLIPDLYRFVSGLALEHLLFVFSFNLKMLFLNSKEEEREWDGFCKVVTRQILQILLCQRQIPADIVIFSPTHTGTSLLETDGFVLDLFGETVKSYFLQTLIWFWPQYI